MSTTQQGVQGLEVATMPILDLDMLANDIARMLDRYGYQIDAGADDIRPHLPAFIAKVQQSVGQRAVDAGDAAVWKAALGVLSADPVPQSGRRPRMSYLPWLRSQRVLMGAAAIDEHYWQCPYAGCRVWAGPYTDPVTAKQAGHKHVHTAHADQHHRSQR
jgi:hypothetical protein